MSTPIDFEKYPPSGDPAKVPALPVPNASNALDFANKVKEILDVREGRRGSAYEKVVTWRDLYKFGIVTPQQGASTASQGGVVLNVNGITGTTYQKLVTDLEKDIRNSASFKRLTAKIGSLDEMEGFPDELRSALSTAITDIARQRQADIQTIERKIQTESQSVASRITEVTAAVDSASAGIRTVDFAYATKTKALASQITTVSASLSSLSGQVASVQTTATATASAVSGLQAQYTLKVAAGNKIAGFDIASTSPTAGGGTSTFTVMSDKFAIYNGTTDTFPFVVDGSGIAINSSVRVAGAVSASQITAGATSDSRGQIDMLGFSTVLKLTRTNATTLPALFVSDTAGAGTQSLYVSSNSTHTYSVSFDCGSTTTLGVTSSNSGYSAAKFINSGASKQVWLAPGAYSAYSPSGGGKFYAVDGNGPFTGFHDGLILKGEYTIGDILVDKGVVYKPDVNNTLTEVELSANRNQKGVIGVLSALRPVDDFLNIPYETWWGYQHTHDVAELNAVGEGQINVCGENGNIEKGDLIVASSIPGKGMKQDDDIVRSYTVAKAREAVVFDTPDQVKMVACIYLCG